MTCAHLGIKPHKLLYRLSFFLPIRIQFAFRRYFVTLENSEPFPYIVSAIFVSTYVCSRTYGVKPSAS